ncbi:MAG: hypothetical protein RLZZ306_2649 [Bacteroidota bacterium]|jgi:hypothetical protein
MKRLLILILILLGLFFVFFYFSLGSQPNIVGKEETPPTGTELDSTIKNNPIYASYVYVKGAGYVLRDRRIVLLIGQDTAQSRQGDAIKSVEKDLESYWKWQVLLGRRNIEDIPSRQNQKGEYDVTKSRETSKNIFSRILDVFKVADAVNVIRDTAKTCDCDDDLLLLAGPGLHLISTTLNPDGGAAGMGPLSESINSEINYKSPTQAPQIGSGKSGSFLVGIIDSGINFGGEIKKTYKFNNNEVFITPKIQSSLNYNFMKNNTEVIDSVNHGTKVARIIIKNTTSDNLRLVALKTFDKNKISNLYDNLCAMIYAIKHDMKVVNASWGASVKESMPVFDQVLRRAKAANMVVVCSAGNDNIDIDLNPYYPACYADHSELGSHVITVTSKYDSVCQNFSSSGKKIDLTVKTDALCNHAIPGAMGNMTGIFESGTSYAAPYVTAGVINYLLLHPSGFSKSGYIGTIPSGSDIRIY